MESLRTRDSITGPSGVPTRGPTSSFMRSHLTLCRTTVPMDLEHNSDTQLTPRWRSKRLTTSLSHVPATSGLYAYGHDNTTCLGLGSDRTYAYIGETEDLRRRLRQHTPRTEAIIGLRKYFVENSSVVRCWYWPLDDVSESTRKRLEQQLIRVFKPIFNTLWKT